MNDTGTKNLYQLLPAVYRLRDSERGFQLRELLQVIQQEVDVVQANITQLYENQFVETCEPWGVPYIGELVGIKRARGVEQRNDPSERVRRRQSLCAPRREVADAVRHYRRKGTISVLEDLANIVADWPARAVEFYELVARSKGISHFTPAIGEEAVQPFGGTLNVRDTKSVAQVDRPFDQSAHYPDVRQLQGNRRSGRYHPAHVGLFVWTRQAYSLTRTIPACLRGGCCGQCDELAVYTFNPLGISTHLHIKPQREAGETDIAEERHVPEPLSLESFRDPDNPKVASRDYYGRDRSVQIWVRKAGSWEMIPRDRVAPWDLNALTRKCNCQDDSGDDSPCQDASSRLNLFFEQNASHMVAVDPERGLLAFRIKPQSVEVTFHYGFSADLGGGEYRRPLYYDDRRQTNRIRFRCTGLLDQSDKEKKSVLKPCDIIAEASLRETKVFLLTTNIPPQEPPGFSIYDTRGVALTGRAKPSTSFKLTIEDKTETAKVNDRGVWHMKLPKSLTDGSVVVIANARYTASRYQGIRLPVKGSSAKKTILELTDSSVYRLNPTKFFVDCGHELQIRSVNGHRPLIRSGAEGCDAALQLFLAPGSRVVLDGIALSGGAVTFENWNGLPPNNTTLANCNGQPDHCGESDQRDAEPAVVTIRDCTINPPLNGSCGKTALKIDLRDTLFTIDQSIIGRICSTKPTDAELQTAPTRLCVLDSIVDGSGETALQGLGLRLKTERATWLGSVTVDEIALAQDCIFTGVVTATRHQLGAMRFCYVSDSPKSPRRYYCQPDLATRGRKDCGSASSDDHPCDVQSSARTSAAHPEPRFVSDHYGHPGYGQLSLVCPDEIRRGAEDGAELGVFHDLYQPQRTDHLQQRLDAFQPASMAAAIFFEPEEST